MRDRLMMAWGAVQAWLPDFRDLHIYGGLCLFAIAGFLAVGWFGPMAAGATLFYLGVWRMA